MKKSSYDPVYELTRGSTIESIHFGAVAVVNSTGTLVASYGNPETVTFLRSTAKPFQALPFVESGGPGHFGFTQKELALLCASHHGTDDHAATAAAVQAKAGLQESHLLCGVHPPSHEETRKRLQEAGEQPTPNRHNCSGKHSGMLSLAALNGWPLADYVNLDHPVQQAILQAFAEMCRLEPGQVALGIDGCSAPNFAVPLVNAAGALAQLSQPDQLPEARAAACRQLTAAMTAHPDMVAGPGGFDTVLMEATHGRMVSKGGAEGYQGIGLMPGALGDGSEALGIALKISDGGIRSGVRSAVAVEVLRQLGALSTSELEQLAKFQPMGTIHNWRKLEIGEKRPAFTLQWA
jgi:L-asparaginase II